MRTSLPVCALHTCRPLACLRYVLSDTPAELFTAKMGSQTSELGLYAIPGDSIHNHLAFRLEGAEVYSNK